MLLSTYICIYVVRYYLALWVLLSRVTQLENFNENGKDTILLREWGPNFGPKSGRSSAVYCNQIIVDTAYNYVHYGRIIYLIKLSKWS